MSLTRRIAVAYFGVAACSLSVMPARAQSYTAKPLRLIVATTPGGPSDLLGRGFGSHISQKTGVSVAVENRAGANSIIGADAVAKAMPDGYTLLVTTGTAITINQHVFRKLPYQPDKDLVPVAKLGASHFLMYARKDLPFNDAKGLIDYLRENPGKLSIGINGVATPPHFAVKRLEIAAGSRFNIIQYKGAAPAFTDLIGGQLDLVLEAPLIGIQYVRNNTVKAVATTAPSRMSALPQVATFAEIYPGFEAFSWFGVMAPAGTPKEAVSLLNRMAREYIEDPAVKERMAGLHVVLDSMTPAQMERFIAVESSQWAELIKRTGIAVE